MYCCTSREFGLWSSNSNAKSSLCCSKLHPLRAQLAPGLGNQKDTPGAAQATTVCNMRVYQSVDEESSNADYFIGCQITTRIYLSAVLCTTISRRKKGARFAGWSLNSFRSLRRAPRGSLPECHFTTAPGYQAAEVPMNVAERTCGASKAATSGYYIGTNAVTMRPVSVPKTGLFEHPQIDGIFDHVDPLEDF